VFFEEVSVLYTLAHVQYECANGACTPDGHVRKGKVHPRTDYEGPEGE